MVRHEVCFAFFEYILLTNVGPLGAGKTTLVKLMTGELNASMGDIRPHGHLKMGRFTQHFVDVLDLTKTPLEFFETIYPGDPRDEQRKYLGRFGVSGKQQVQSMSELSDGQKSRVVFAKLGRDVPHIVSHRVLSCFVQVHFLLLILFNSCCWTNQLTIWTWRVSTHWQRR